MIRLINIAREFSRSPAGRYREDGPYSGQTFRDRFLVPALEAGDDVVLEMDGTRGFGSSFLDEAFGGLLRICGYESSDLLARIVLKTNDPSLALEVKRYLAGK